MKINWKRVLTASAVLVAGTVTALLFSKKKDDFEDWLKNALDEELSDEYEQRRQKWAETGFGGDGEKTSEMKRIEREMSERYEEKWENDDRRSTDPCFRWTDANRWDKD